jgi:neutral ceramidase
MESLPANGACTEICARACCLEMGGRALLLVSCDLLFLEKQTHDELRGRIEALTGVPRAHIVVHTTHTHAGPALTSLFNDNSVDQDESRKMCDGVVASGVQAFRTMRAGRIGFGRVDVPNMAFNRRYRMRDGTVETHPYKDDPNILDAEGPVDPELNVLYGLDEAGTCIGAVANFACHLTSLERDNTLFSADFPSFAEAALRQAPGCSGVVLVYANGPCGNLCPVNVASPGTREVGIEHTRRMGTRFAAAVREAIEKGKAAEEMPDLACIYREIRIPIREITAGMVADARATVERLKGTTPTAPRLSDYGVESCRDSARVSVAEMLKSDFWKNIAAHELLDLHRKHETDNCVDVPLTVARIGHALMITVPAELFVEFSLTLKERFKGTYDWVFVIELANGSVGYVPTRRAFEPAEGGYEVQLLNSSKLCPDAGELIGEEIASMERELRTGRTPQAPRAAR